MTFDKGVFQTQQKAHSGEIWRMLAIIAHRFYVGAFMQE